MRDEEERGEDIEQKLVEGGAVKMSCWDSSIWRPCVISSPRPGCVDGTIPLLALSHHAYATSRSSEGDKGLVVPIDCYGRGRVFHSGSCISNQHSLSCYFVGQIDGEFEPNGQMFSTGTRRINESHPLLSLHGDVNVSTYTRGDRDTFGAVLCAVSSS